MPSKMKSKQSSSVFFGFIVIVCINVAVLIYISLQMLENQTQFETLRRTDEMRHLQMLQDQELKQYHKMEMIQSVHYGKTKDQRERDHYEKVNTEKYLDIQSLEWVLNMQDQNMQYQIAQDIAVQNRDEQDLIVNDKINMHEQALKMKDEKEPDNIKVHDRKQQDLNNVNGKKDQDKKEQDLNEQNQYEQDENKQEINIQNINEIDHKLQDHENQGQSVHDNKEEPDLKVLDGKEEKYKSAQGDMNQDIQHEDIVVLKIQGQGTKYPTMEHNKQVLDKKDYGLSVDDQEHNLEKGEQDINVYLAELEQKKQNEGTQHENEREIHNKEGDQDIQQDPTQQGAMMQGKEDNNLNVQVLNENDPDLKGKQMPQVQNQTVQDSTEQGFQVKHQLLKQEPKSQFNRDLNDKILEILKQLDAKAMNQIVTKLDRELSDQNMAGRWPQDQVEVTEASGVSEVQTVAASEVLAQNTNDRSDVSEREVQTTTAMSDILDGKSLDVKTSTPSIDSEPKSAETVSEQRTLKVKRESVWSDQEMSYGLDQEERISREGNEMKKAVDDLVLDGEILKDDVYDEKNNI